MNIDSKTEVKTIASFLKKTFKQTAIPNAIIGLSGGIDSTTSFYLLKQTLPPKNIHVAHLYYFEPKTNLIGPVLQQAKIPHKNIHLIDIKDIVDAIAETVKLADGKKSLEKIRLGNIMARTRMVVLYDLAKKCNALVVGTENKTEHHLGYFTRFGDEASDIEPIKHLYKTQVYELAKYLGVPEEIIKAKPSAGLWRGQTDEGEFGFSYEEADQVLNLYFDKKQPLIQIKKKIKNAAKIIDFCQKNSYKHHVPYSV